MARQASIRIWITAVAVVLTAGAHGAAQREGDRDAFQRFQQSTNEYVALHRQIERNLPPLDMPGDGGSIQQAVEARADAIRRARADARAGDIFTADVRLAFRSRILEAVEWCGDVAPDVDREADGGGEAWEPPVVNGTFSWRRATLTSPCVLAVLPELPQELQYRFLRSDLLLVDIEANLIIDVLRDAVPRAPAPDRLVYAASFSTTTRPSAFRYTRYLLPSLHEAAKSFSACTVTATTSPHGIP